MKPQLLKVPTKHTDSFSARQDMYPNINNRWHYHTEVEMIHFHCGSGMQFIGNHISRFQAGDIVLVGSNLPHYWRYDDEAYLEQPFEKPYSTVIHFTENFWGKDFLALPETRELKLLLNDAKKGLLARAVQHPNIALHMQQVLQQKGFNKLLSLLACLQSFYSSENIVRLSAINYSNNIPDSESERIEKIYNFTANHFKRKIALSEIAALVNLEPNSFCRYFKVRTGKNYTAFLQEIRVNHACKLLLENKLNIKQVCFESGFNNFSCFHKGFKEITGQSPKSYQSAFLSNNTSS